MYVTDAEDSQTLCSLAIMLSMFLKSISTPFKLIRHNLFGLLKCATNYLMFRMNSKLEGTEFFTSNNCKHSLPCISVILKTCLNFNISWCSFVCLSQYDAMIVMVNIIEGNKQLFFYLLHRFMPMSQRNTMVSCVAFILKFTGNNK